MERRLKRCFRPIIRNIAILSGAILLGAFTLPWEVPVPDKSPVSQQGLIESDCEKAGDQELMDRYSDIDRRFFAGRLPRIPVLWEPRLQRIGEPRGWRLEGMWGYKGDHACILLNPSLRYARGQTLEGTLCHEMLHEYFHFIGNDHEGHGVEFQRELYRLWRGGAFPGTPASQADIEAFRRSLDATERDLLVLRRELRYQSDNLTRLNDLVNDYNQRMVMANARGYGWPPDNQGESLEAAARERAAVVNALVDRYNDGVSKYDAQVQRYNEMIEYPVADGMDERALVEPETPAAKQAAAK